MPNTIFSHPDFTTRHDCYVISGCANIFAISCNMNMSCSVVDIAPEVLHQHIQITPLGRSSPKSHIERACVFWSRSYLVGLLDDATSVRFHADAPYVSPSQFRVSWTRINLVVPNMDDLGACCTYQLVVKYILIKIRPEQVKVSPRDWGAQFIDNSGVFIRRGLRLTSR